MIVHEQGNQRYGSRGSAPPGHNVSDRLYFIAQRDGTAAGLFMSEPLVTRSEGRAAVVLSAPAGLTMITEDSQASSPQSSTLTH